MFPDVGVFIQSVGDTSILADIKSDNLENYIWNFRVIAAEAFIQGKDTMLYLLKVAPSGVQFTLESNELIVYKRERGRWNLYQEVAVPNCVSICASKFGKKIFLIGQAQVYELKNLKFAEGMFSHFDRIGF